MNLSIYALFLVTLLLSVEPSKANINLMLGDGENGESNPFEDVLCGILNCDSDGELGMFDTFENMWDDLSESSLNIFFGDDEDLGFRQRKLRGNKN